MEGLGIYLLFKPTPAINAQEEHKWVASFSQEDPGESYSENRTAEATYLARTNTRRPTRHVPWNLHTIHSQPFIPLTLKFLAKYLQDSMHPRVAGVPTPKAPPCTATPCAQVSMLASRGSHDYAPVLLMMQVRCDFEFRVGQAAAHGGDCLGFALQHGTSRKGGLRMQCVGALVVRIGRWGGYYIQYDYILLIQGPVLCRRAVHMGSLDPPTVQV